MLVDSFFSLPSVVWSSFFFEVKEEIFLMTVRPIWILAAAVRASVSVASFLFLLFYFVRSFLSYFFFFFLVKIGEEYDVGRSCREITKGGESQLQWRQDGGGGGECKERRRRNAGILVVKALLVSNLLPIFLSLRVVILDKMYNIRIYAPCKQNTL